MPYDKVGDVHLAQGDLAGGLATYRESLATFSAWRRPIPATPAGSGTWPYPFPRLASVYLAQNDDARGREALEGGRAIMVKLVALSPDNATWKSDLAWFDGRIAALEP